MARSTLQGKLIHPYFLAALVLLATPANARVAMLNESIGCSSWQILHTLKETIARDKKNGTALLELYVTRGLCRDLYPGVYSEFGFTDAYLCVKPEDYPYITNHCLWVRREDFEDPEVKGNYGQFN
jgi:hypothetical protein